VTQIYTDSVILVLVLLQTTGQPLSARAALEETVEEGASLAQELAVYRYFGAAEIDDNVATL